MSINNKNISGFNQLFVFQIMFLLFCFVNGVLVKLPLTTSLIYFVFQLLMIFIPGLALSTYLKLYKNSNEALVYSYVIGLIFVMFEFYFVMLLHISKISIAIGLITSILSILYLYKNKNIIHIEKDNSFYYLFSVVVIVFVLCLINISLANPSPDVFGDTGYSKDFLYWIGNSITFTKGLPAQEFRLVGENLYYHYF